MPARPRCWSGRGEGAARSRSCSKGPTPARSTPTRRRPARSTSPAACRSRRRRSAEVLLAYKMNGEDAAGRARRAAPGGRRRVVRHGVGEVADADRRHRQAVPRLLPDARLRVLRAPRSGLPTLVPVTAIQPKAVHRPAGARRGDPGRQAVPPVRGGAGPASGPWQGRGQPRRREDVGRGQAVGEAKPFSGVLWEYGVEDAGAAGPLNRRPGTDDRATRSRRSGTPTGGRT